MRAEMAGRTGHDIIHPDVTHLEAGPRIFFVDRLMQARPAAVNGEAQTPASAEGSLLVTICQARTSPHNALDQHSNPAVFASFRRFGNSDFTRASADGRLSLSTRDDAGYLRTQAAIHGRRDVEV